MHDASDKHKIVDNLLAHLAQVLQELEVGWGCSIIAIAIDMSGESHTTNQPSHKNVHH